LLKKTLRILSRAQQSVLCGDWLLKLLLDPFAIFPFFAIISYSSVLEDEKYYTKEAK
jgi:hypothetical protein